jgi:hypothetical protein
MGAEEHLFGALRVIERSNRSLSWSMQSPPACAWAPSRRRFEYAFRLLTACKERGIACLFTSQLVRGEAGGRRRRHRDGQPRFPGGYARALALRRIQWHAAPHGARPEARGMAHSSDCHEFRLTDHGIEVLAAK